MEKQCKIDPAVALALWNEGLSLGQIAACFTDTTRSAARYAVQQAVKAGLGQARQGRYKPAPASPPLAALWTEQCVTT